MEESLKTSQKSVSDMNKFIEKEDIEGFAEENGEQEEEEKEEENQNENVQI